MERRLKQLAFDEWLRFIFDHPTEGPEWYWAPDAPFWDGPASLTIDYVTRLFADPVPFVAGYSDAQVNLGLHYVISPGLGEHMLCLGDSAVPLAARIDCVRACGSLFRKLLLPRCSPHLSHHDEPGSAPLNAVCYMWWDTMPVYDADTAERDALQRAALETMMAILRLPSLACQESALHGLGHWHRTFPAEIEQAIDAFLARHPDARPDLMTYARAARCGCVL